MIRNSITVLLIEDNPADARLIKEMLAESSPGDFKLEWFDRLSMGIEYLKDHSVDVVLLDLTLPDSTGIATFEKLFKHAPHLPIIVLTGVNDEQMAIESMRSGLQDYLIKNKVDGEMLSRSMSYSIERKRLEEALRTAHDQQEMRVKQRTLELSNANQALRDEIAERKKVEQELKDSKELADLYVDLMAHDISNMHQIAMSQLSLAHEIMEEDGKLERDDKELIETPLLTLERSARLIENVRKLQKLRAGEYKMEPIDLGRLLAEVIEEYSCVPDMNVTIGYVPVQGYCVWSNLLLKDVFANIIGNAIKHSSRSASIGIGVSKVNENGNAFYCVAIEDNGPGIPDDRKEEVFHRFKRGNTKARGTGLGLYIVKTLVESYYGHVKVEDRVPGDHTKGSKFLVYLPLIDKEGRC